jgi:hypothetical protein
MVIVPVTSDGGGEDGAVIVRYPAVLSAPSLDVGFTEAVTPDRVISVTWRPTGPLELPARRIVSGTTTDSPEGRFTLWEACRPIMKSGGADALRSKVRSSIVMFLMSEVVASIRANRASVFVCSARVRAPSPAAMPLSVIAMVLPKLLNSVKRTNEDVPSVVDI